VHIPRWNILKSCSAVFCFFLLSVGASRGAGSEWFARTWQSDDGLPDNSITSVAQGSDGYLWVATQGGLVRFDGVQFKRLSLPIVSGMPFGMIRALTVAEDNHMWFALEGGVVISATPEHTKIFTSANGLPVFRPLSITEDAEGAIWVGYSDGSACRFFQNEVKRFSGRDGLPGIGVCMLAADAKRQLWFTKVGQVGKFRDGKFISLVTMPDRLVCIGARAGGGLWICSGREFFKYEEGQKPVKMGELASTGELVEPLTVFEDRSGAVWIGTAASGLFRFDGTNIERIGTSRGEIRSITGDREGNIWVGSSGDGLSRLCPRILRLYGVEDGLPFETIRSIGEDGSGSLWAVTQNGFLARSQNDRWLTINTNSDWPGGQASCVAGDGAGSVWIGTSASGLYQWANGKYTVMRRANGLASDRVWTLMADSSDRLWIALDGTNCVQCLAEGKLTKFNLPAGSHVVRALAEGVSHDIWLGTEDGRLLRVKGTNLLDETPHTLARALPIRCLQTTPDGSLWIGYAGAGLGLYKSGKFFRIGMEQGLPDDFVSQIVEDEQQDALWFAGNSGIFKIQRQEVEAVATGDQKRVHPVVFGKNEGLPSLQANFGFGLPAIRTRDGRICFSMLTGLAVAYPDKIPLNKLPPPVIIERVRVDGQAIVLPGDSQLLGDEINATNFSQASEGLDIPPQHRELKIDFNALSFVSPENVRLRYQLEGYDQKWIETSQRNATYSRMPSGDYQFHVIACNNSGVWNESGSVLRFRVLPFFWQTWWFRLGLVSIFTVSLMLTVYFILVRRLRTKLLRLEQETAMQKDRARIAKDLHDDLGANLSQIAMLSELAQTDLDKPVQAHGHIDQIFRTARLLTRSLDEIVWAINPRNDSLDGFVAHICQFAPEFLRTAGIRPRLDMPMDLPPLKLEPNVRHQMYLALKEALHNVIKHSGATEVWVRLKIYGDTLALTVEDNGRGFETNGKPKAVGNGLMNFRYRMEEIGGKLEQHSEPEKGTCITFIASARGKT
jgi:ligand-binding sensor domain-containing protein